MKVKLRDLCVAAVCLCACMVLPFLTGQIPQIGAALSPMHIPVLLAGFLCGWPYATAVGLLAPALRFFLFGMPPLMPTGLAMTLELAVYGLSASLLRRALPKNAACFYIALVVSMLAGRVAWGAARLALAGLNNGVFTFADFLAGAFVSAVPGIVCHLLVIPPLAMALERALKHGARA